MTFQNSKSDLHRSNLRLMTYEPLLQISAQSDHEQSGIGPLMKSGHDVKNRCFSLFSSFSLMTVRKLQIRSPPLILKIHEPRTSPPNFNSIGPWTKKDRTFDEI